MPPAHGIERQRQAQAGRDGDADEDAAPVDGDLTGVDGDGVHFVTSDSGIAVAK